MQKGKALLIAIALLCTIACLVWLALLKEHSPENAKNVHAVPKFSLPPPTPSESEVQLGESINASNSESPDGSDDRIAALLERIRELENRIAAVERTYGPLPEDEDYPGGGSGGASRRPGKVETIRGAKSARGRGRNTTPRISATNAKDGRGKPRKLRAGKPLPKSFKITSRPRKRTDKVRIHGVDAPGSGGDNASEDESAGLYPGLVGLYFTGTSLQNHKLTRIDDTDNFDFKNGPPEPSLPKDRFSISWIGYIYIQQEGNYTFYTSSDDGVRLYIDGRAVIWNWTDHGNTLNNVYLHLKEGYHAVRLDYYENGGYSIIKLWWASTTFGRQIIPSHVLYHHDEQEYHPPG